METNPLLLPGAPHPHDNEVWFEDDESGAFDLANGDDLNSVLPELEPVALPERPSRPMLKVHVESNYGGQNRVFEGDSASVYEQLCDAFPWLRSSDSEHHGDVAAAVEQLDSTQSFDAWLEADDLEKGAMSRFPFDPKKDAIPGQENIYHWQDSAEHADRDAIPPMEGNVRVRALHHLHGRAEAVRMNGRGEREFLLHRASASGKTGDRRTSWMTNRGAYGNSFGSRPYMSAWIPESSIISIPRAMGTMRGRDEQGRLWNRISGKPYYGAPNEYAPEYEVIVAPGEYERHVAPLTKSESEVDDQYNTPLHMLGANHSLHPMVLAAQFLSGRSVDPKLMRSALYHHGDFAPAALEAHGLEPTDGNLKSLHALAGMIPESPSESEQPPAGKSIIALTPEAEEAAEMIASAFKAKTVKVAHLDGKHSKGSLIARDEHSDHTLLLKPGSGGPGPAAGVNEQVASPSRREACFSAMADDWGLEHDVPRCELVAIDGREYAAIYMLPFDWRGLEQKEDKHPGIGMLALEKYREEGTLHRWAVLDYVLGNPDRHRDNVMISGDNKELGLIDHGSSFAGRDFDPAFDQNSFVPYYLRAWAGPNFHRLDVAGKLKKMPLAGGRDADLKSWVGTLHVERLEAICHRFGIDPSACAARLAKVKVAMLGAPSASAAIDRLWVTT